MKNYTENWRKKEINSSKNQTLRIKQTQIEIKYETFITFAKLSR